MVIAYDGTNYAGWQVQPNGLTVQECIEAAIQKIGGSKVKLHGSGRTDQGVHARGQVAHADLPTHITPAGWRRALNALLPSDIRVMRVSKAKAGFHARKNALAKEYRYFICNAAVMPPQHRLYTLHYPGELDLNAMRQAATQLCGTNDFAAFTANPNRIVESTVRTVFKINVSRRCGIITILVKGDGFLYKMVRSIAGYLLRVGAGELPANSAGEILASRIRTARVPTAPPHGLFLWHVTY